MIFMMLSTFLMFKINVAAYKSIDEYNCLNWFASNYTSYKSLLNVTI